MNRRRYVRFLAAGAIVLLAGVFAGCNSPGAFIRWRVRRIILLAGVFAGCNSGNVAEAQTASANP
jgi:predicted small secreted protein